MEIFQVFRFEASHLLPKLPEGHPCRRLHGHSYRVEIRISGPVEEGEGWVVDFADVEKVFRPVLDELDHSHLNEIEGLENPTCERMAIWVWRRLKPVLPLLSGIVIHETDSSGCLYRGEEEE